MQYVAVVIILAGFLAGVLAARRVVPPLARSREGRLAFAIVAVLVGAAAGVTTDALWTGARAITETSGQTIGPASLAEQVITSTAQEILLQAGALTALAAIVYLLAPATSQD